MDEQATEGPNDNTYVFEGTSSSAPVVSAAAAVVRSHWPQLAASEIIDILLTSADQTFSDLYERNDCGETKDVNCGAYYFGSGKLDLETAMTPDGPLSIPADDHVAGAAGHVAGERGRPRVRGSAQPRTLHSHGSTNLWPGQGAGALG